MTAFVLLEDGTRLDGIAVGAAGHAVGEVVFNTAMTGYQEVLTDPSYAGQMVCMTYPLQGNYGVRDADAESSRPWARSLIVRWACPVPSHHSSEASLDEYLRRCGRLEGRCFRQRPFRARFMLRPMLQHDRSIKIAGASAALIASA